MPAQQEPEFDAAMVRLKKLVFKNRIRLAEFLTDFDRLRKGYILPSHFTRGMAMAGVDKVLSAGELAVIASHYTRPHAPSLDVLWYREFLAEVDIIFTKPGLERTPLEHVPLEPSELLDRNRYQRSSRDLGPEKEARLEELTRRISDICCRRGVLIKPFFDDAAQDSGNLPGHVTHAQFKQCLSVKVAITVSAEEAELLIAKYAHDDPHMNDLVNYVAFSHTVDPPLDAFEQYV